jgi:DNA end-binding protein Ku
MTQLPLLLLERPYYLQPGTRAGHVYALLRESMRAAGVAGIARIVIHNKEHLAAVIVIGDALVLDVLRWEEDLRSEKSLELPGRRETGTLKATELQMARRLIGEMTGPWKAHRYTEDFSAKIGSLIRKKLAAGKAKALEPLEKAPTQPTPSNVIDLADLLRRSMSERRAPAKAVESSRKTGAARRAG